jgi:hypothetical protein
MSERLEIALSKYEIRIRISNVHYNLITVCFWSHSNIKKIAHPTLEKLSPLSLANRQTLRSSRGPYYEFNFTLSLWFFIVPRFFIPLVLSACFTNTTTLTSAAAFAIDHRTSSTSPAPPSSTMVDSIGSKGITMPASSQKQH